MLSRVNHNRAWQPGKLQRLVDEAARQMADEETARIPWPQLLKARQSYVKWQEFLLWARAIEETERCLPEWLACVVKKRCPGFEQFLLSYTWVKRALEGAGLVAKGRKRGVHRKRRPRRPLPGMLLHLDASEHRWFQDDRWYDLIVVMDDATNEVYYAQLVEEESTRTVMAALCQVVEERSVFCELYSDRASRWMGAD